MIRRPPRSTLSSSSAASDVYKRQDLVWKPGMLLEVEVSHEYGRWNVKYKEGISATWSQEKTGNEKLLNFAFGNIGLYYKFNTAHGGQIWVDDVSMNFENRAPDLHEVRSVGRDQILLLFSEPCLLYT